MTSTTIANEIYLELNSPTDVTVSEIDYWLTTNIGKLNNLINTEYSIDATTLLITPEMGDDSSVIYKTMYFIKYYGNAANNNLGASGVGFTLEVTSDGSTVRRASKTELAKVYLQLRKQYMDELQALVTGYKSNNSPPRQVVGIDSLTLVENTPQYNRVIDG